MYGYYSENIDKRMDKIGWEVIPGTGCWEWSGAKAVFGHGLIWVGAGKTVGVHRISFQRWKGEIPEGEVIRHICDNPPCMNPEHLITGTQAENFHDMVTRSRQPKGERHGRATLNWTKVREIRQRAAEGEKGRDLAAEYGVSPAQINNVVKGYQWIEKEELS